MVYFNDCCAAHHGEGVALLDAAEDQELRLIDPFMANFDIAQWKDSVLATVLLEWTWHEKHLPSFVQILGVQLVNRLPLPLI